MKMAKEFQKLIESRSIDIMYIRKEIQRYNSGSIDMDKLTSLIFSHSGVKTNQSQQTKIINALEDHIENSMDGTKIPNDIAGELYNICYNTF